MVCGGVVVWCGVWCGTYILLLSAIVGVPDLIDRSRYDHAHTHDHDHDHVHDHAHLWLWCDRSRWRLLLFSVLVCDLWTWLGCDFVLGWTVE